MSDLRTAAQQALEALEGGADSWQLVGPAIDALKEALVEDAMQKFTDVNQEIEAALAEPVLQTCNCRWDGEMQMQQCTLHEAHVDAIKEWAQRAKFAEKKLAALAEQRLTDVQQEMERSIESLKAALAEPVLNPAPGYCKHCKQYTIEEPLPAEPAQEQPVCDECGKHKHDGWALYCVKCVEPMFTSKTEPVEPVAWMFELARNFNLEGYGGWEKRITEYRPNTPEGSVRNVTPLYTAPPQRKPLTETSAERTLKRLGYTDCGGEFWKPPLGAPAESVQEPQCNPHPKAPHGFLRNASHNEDRYVCECEGWEPYEAGYQAGMEAALRAQS